MKKLLIGLFVFGSFASFASDIQVIESSVDENIIKVRLSIPKYGVGFTTYPSYVAKQVDCRSKDGMTIAYVTFERKHIFGQQQAEWERPATKIEKINRLNVCDKPAEAVFVNGQQVL